MYFEFFEYLDEISFIFFLTYSSYFFSYLSSKIILLNFLNIGIKKSLLNLLTFNCLSNVDRTKLLDDKKYNLYIKITYRTTFLKNKWKKTLNGHVNTLGNVVHIIPIMLIVGFITPRPYNYWRLKKFDLACH